MYETGYHDLDCNPMSYIVKLNADGLLFMDLTPFWVGAGARKEADK